MPDKLIWAALMRTDEGTKLDQAAYIRSTVIEGMCCFDVRKVSTPLYPGMDLSSRQENGRELDISIFPYARILGTLMPLAGMTRPDISCII